MFFTPLCLLLIIDTIYVVELLNPAGKLKPRCFSVIAPKLSPNQKAAFELFRETSIASPHTQADFRSSRSVHHQ